MGADFPPELQLTAESSRWMLIELLNLPDAARIDSLSIRGGRGSEELGLT